MTKKLKIEWSYDDHECELCGTSWATGAKVTLDDVVILDAPAVAHCQGSVNVEEGHILYHLCKHLGIEVEGLDQGLMEDINLYPSIERIK